MGIKIFFSDLACGVKALKPCTQTGVCGACARSLGALGTGVRPPAGTALSLPRSVFCGWLFILSFYVVRAAYNIKYDRFFPSQSPLLLNFFQDSRQVAVAFGFRHFWGVCLHLLLWSLLSHFFLHPVP